MRERNSKIKPEYGLIEIYIENDIFRRILVTEDNEMDLLTVSENSERSEAGDIYSGFIKSVNRSESSVFIDIGQGKNAYSFFSNKDDLKDLTQGQKVMVEVLREASGRKGAKVTFNPSVTDSYISVKRGSGVRFSKRCDRKVIFENLGRIDEIPGFELTVRSLSVELDKDEFRDRTERLISLYQDLENKTSALTRPELIYRSNKDIMDVLSIYGKSIHMVHCNDAEVSKFLKTNYPFIHVDETKDRDLLYKAGFEGRIEKLKSSGVSLNGSGFLTIEESEALTFIDVDSGKGFRGTDPFYINVSAAEEIARQIRLRNLSGIILCDFINMESEEKQRALLEKFQSFMDNDICKSTVYGVTSLGLIEVSRRRRGRSLSQSLFFKEKVNSMPLSCGYLLKNTRIAVEKTVDQGSDKIEITFNPVYSEIGDEITESLKIEFPETEFRVRYDIRCETVSVKRIYG